LKLKGLIMNTQMDLKYFLNNYKHCQKKGFNKVFICRTHGLHIYLQKEVKKSGELTPGINYRGRKKRDPMSEKYKLSPKIYYGGVFASDQFWKQTTAEIYEYFQFDKKSISVLNRDGAFWVSSGAEYLPGFYTRFLDSLR